MKRRPSQFALVLALAVGAVLATIAAGAGILLSVPVSPPPGQPLNEILAAYSSEERAAAQNYRRVTRAEPPTGPRSELLESFFAKALKRAPHDVRAVWLSDWRRVENAGSNQDIAIVAGHEVLVKATPAGGFSLTYGQAVDLSGGAVVPPVMLAVRKSDATWLVVWKRRSLGEANGKLVLALIAATLALVSFAWFMASILTRPIGEMARAAALADLGHAPEQSEKGTREVVAARRALATMHERLRNAAAERSFMLAAIAHDLKNPLASLLVRVEQLPPASRASLQADLNRITAMLSRVLDFTRSLDRPLEARPVNLSALAREIVADFQEIGEAVTADLEAELVTVFGDADDIRRALDNVITNGLSYAGSAHVELRTSDAERSLVVSDTGPGIPEDQITVVTRPFVRLDKSRNRESGGFGLGLAIVQMIMSRQGGELRLNNRDEGGLRAELVFPAP